MNTVSEKDTAGTVLPSSTPDCTPVVDASGQPVFLDVFFVDVGNGNCTILRSSDGHAMLVDAGSAGDAETVIRTAEEAGIERFDLVFATLADSRHIGGLPSVLQEIPADLCCMTESCRVSDEAVPLLTVLQQQGVPVRTVLADRSSVVPWSDFTEVRILSPYDAAYDDPKDWSVMLRISLGSTAVLLSGDAHKAAERLAVKAFPNAFLRSDVLLVGDHGNADSSGEKYLSAVRPSVAVISCGSRHMPDDSVIRALTERGATVLLTENSGTVHIALDGVSATVIQ